ncbi:MAG: hypothetical protein EXR52_07045 [Dehalococcoidia bacterium]|nr:hypothetical protein [Dehalococcoidia bacterium]
MRVITKLAALVLTLLAAGLAEGDSPLSGVAAATSRIGYGVNDGEGRLDLITGMGFNWIKLTAPWKQYEPARGAYDWRDLDGRVDRARAKGLKVMIRVDDTPDWASSKPGFFNAPPANDGDLANFMGTLAARYKGKVGGYEIWNEPNLDYEWGLINPDPVRFGEMLKALYPRVKLADPAAVVITGGLSTAGDGTSGPYLGDLYYLSKLVDPNQDRDPSDGYAAYFDAIGSHPYGGPYAADTPPSVARNDIGTYFRRAEEQHALVLAEARVDKPVWATEFGWFLDPAVLGQGCDFGSHFNRLKVSADFQAAQLVNSYQYAAANWPWMGPMFLFNLDMSLDSWRAACEQVRYFAILRGDGSPLPAYTALAAMPKLGVRLPNQPLAVGPADGAVLPNLSPTLNWETPAGAAQVHLQVIPANNDGPGLNLIIAAAQSFGIPAPPDWFGMLPGMGYTWRVRTTTSSAFAPESDPSWGPWSERIVFRTPSPSSSIVALVSPADGATTTNVTPSLRWSSASAQLFYWEVQISRDPAFETNPAKAIASVYQNLVHGGLTTPANSYAVPSSAPLESRAVYYWRVRPRVQGDGTPVVWTPARMFKTP